MIAADAPGMRLDAFLALRLEGYSRSHLKDLIGRGFVEVDGAARSPDYRLREQDERVAVDFPEVSWRAEPGEFEDWVIHEDESLIVLHKPAGLLMHPLGPSWLETPRAALSEPSANLAGLVQLHRPELIRAGLDRCGLVHRLDRQTSGVLLLAKTRAAQATLVEEFKEREVEKIYRAIVCGSPEAGAASISAPIGRAPGHRRVVVTPFGKTAETGFKVLARSEIATLVEARPLTGRTHQIRAHLGFLGHPVAGDPEFTPKTPLPEPLRPPRTMLHAYCISFRHPASGKLRSFQAEPPADFKAFWRKCRAYRGPRK